MTEINNKIKNIIGKEAFSKLNNQDLNFIYEQIQYFSKKYKINNDELFDFDTFNKALSFLFKNVKLDIFNSYSEEVKTAFFRNLNWNLEPYVWWDYVELINNKFYSAKKMGISELEVIDLISRTNLIIGLIKFFKLSDGTIYDKNDYSIKIEDPEDVKKAKKYKIECGKASNDLSEKIKYFKPANVYGKKLKNYIIGLCEAYIATQHLFPTNDYLTFELIFSEKPENKENIIKKAKLSSAICSSWDHKHDPHYYEKEYEKLHKSLSKYVEENIDSKDLDIIIEEVDIITSDLNLWESYMAIAQNPMIPHNFLKSIASYKDLDSSFNLGNRLSIITEKVNNLKIDEKTKNYVIKNILKYSPNIDKITKIIDSLCPLLNGENIIENSKRVQLIINILNINFDIDNKSTKIDEIEINNIYLSKESTCICVPDFEVDGFEDLILCIENIISNAQNKEIDIDLLNRILLDSSNTENNTIAIIIAKVLSLYSPNITPQVEELINGIKTCKNEDTIKMLGVLLSSLLGQQKNKTWIKFDNEMSTISLIDQMNLILQDECYMTSNIITYGDNDYYERRGMYPNSFCSEDRPNSSYCYTYYVSKK